jgi:hypothetical protein
MDYGEEKMWRAVLEQAFKDVTDRRLPRQDRIEALRWLRNEGLDFQIVCDLADVPPDAVRKKLGRKKVRKTRT